MPVWGLQTCSRQPVGVQDEQRDGGLCRCINQTECNLNRDISAYTSVWQRCGLTWGEGCPAVVSACMCWVRIPVAGPVSLPTRRRGRLREVRERICLWGIYGGLRHPRGEISDWKNRFLPTVVGTVKMSACCITLVTSQPSLLFQRRKAFPVRCQLYFLSYPHSDLEASLETLHQTQSGKRAGETHSRAESASRLERKEPIV